MTVKMADGRGVIRLGDKTDHGGVVVQVAHEDLDMGKPIACKGDLVKCPKCKGTFPIDEGEGTWLIEGVPVAFHGHKTACGAVLLSSWGNFTSDTALAAGSSMTLVQLAEPPAISSSPKYDLRFLVKNQKTGEIQKNLPYKIALSNGESSTGYTDENGLTERVFSEKPLTVKIEVPYYGDHTANTDSGCGSDSCGC